MTKFSLLFSDQSLPELITTNILQPFAHLETRRKNYHKEDLNIVIDATDWGHIVGEIEVMVSTQDQIAEATKRIEVLGKELGKFFLYIYKIRKDTIKPKMTLSSVQSTIG